VQVPLVVGSVAWYLEVSHAAVRIGDPLPLARGRKARLLGRRAWAHGVG